MKKEELQRILEMTPREKAVIVIKKWTEPFIYGEEIPLTKAEKDTIITSFETEEERKEYNRWVSMYDVYSGIEEIFALGYVGLFREVHRIRGYLYLWDAYEQQVETINVLYQAVKDSGSEEALSLFRKAATGYRRFLYKAQIEQRGREYYELNIFDEGLLYDKIKSSASMLRKAYSELKALIIAIEEFSKTTKSEDFNTRRIQECIFEIKMGCKIFNLPLRFSRERLRLRKERGDKTTETDELRAIIPEYEELEVSSKSLERYRNKIGNLKSFIIK